MPKRSDIGPFTMVPEWLFDRVSGNAIRLWCLLGRYANERDEAWPGRAALAKRLRCTKRALYNWVSELQRAQAISVQVRFTESGDWDSFLYKMWFVAPEERGLFSGNAVPGVANEGSAPLENDASAPVRNGGSPKREPSERKSPEPERKGGKRARKGRPEESSALKLPPRLDNPEFRAAWADWDKHRREIKHKLTPQTIRRQIKLCENVEKRDGTGAAIGMIEYAIEKGWQGLFDPINKAAPPERSAAADDAEIAKAEQILADGGAPY